MSYRKKDGCNNDCVVDAVRAIKDAQDAVDDCPTSCFNNLLSPVGGKGDTIPFVLKNSDGSPFYAVGDIGKDDCFPTIWFRVEEIHGSCATLRLLRPFKEHKTPFCVTDLVGEGGCCISVAGQCLVERLKKSDDCIEVDLDCFCAIQCLNPKLVKH